MGLQLFSFKTNFDQITASLKDLPEKQVAFAISLALNKAALGAKKRLVTEMSQVFDKPSPFILNSTFVLSATKRRLEVVIGHKKLVGRISASPILQAEIFGGDRSFKASELALKSKWVPSNLEPRDVHGNISGGTIKKILSGLSLAERYSGSTQNISAASRKRQIARGSYRQFVVIKEGNRGRLRPGVYERKGAYETTVNGKIKKDGISTKRLKPVLYFINKTNYRVRYKFYDVVNNYFKENFNDHMKYAIETTLKTAR
jgi:hypothetical protein